MAGKKVYYLFFAICLALLLFLPLISASQLKVTSEHPFLVNNNWIPASQLQVGDKLKTIDGKTAVIKNIKDVVSDKVFPVYNLQVGGVENYFANDILVHNKPVKNLNPPIEESGYVEPNGWCCLSDKGYPKVVGSIEVRRLTTKEDVVQVVGVIKEAYQRNLLKALGLKGNYAKLHNGRTLEEAIKAKEITLQQAVDTWNPELRKGYIDPHGLGMYDYAEDLYNRVVGGEWEIWLREVREGNRKIIFTISAEGKMTQSVFPSRLSTEVEVNWEKVGIPPGSRVLEVGRYASVVVTPPVPVAPVQISPAQVKLELYEIAKAAKDSCADYVVFLTSKRDARILFERGIGGLEGNPGEARVINEPLGMPYSSSPKPITLFGEEVTPVFEDYITLLKITDELLNYLKAQAGI